MLILGIDTAAAPCCAAVYDTVPDGGNHFGVFNNAVLFAGQRINHQINGVFMIFAIVFQFKGFFARAFVGNKRAGNADALHRAGGQTAFFVPVINAVLD